MSNKKNSFYFDNFIDCIRISHTAASRLKEIIDSYDSENLGQLVSEIHAIEHQGDSKRHELCDEIVKAFITPIDRDDIIRLSQCIDSVTDAVEDIVLGFYKWNITSMRDDAAPFTELIIRCCEATEKVLAELPNYKRSANLAQAIIEVNSCEEAGDKQYLASMRRLVTEEQNPLTVMAWREIYQSFEDVCDCCEQVANIVEAIVIANT